MTDKKISELDAITGANTAADDYFVVVDTSGTATKKISRAELNNAIEADVLSTVNIDGGTIDGTVIGGATPAAGTFTDVTATGSGNRSVTITSSDALASMEIGGTTGAFIDIKTPTSDDYDLRLSGGSTGGGITIAGGTFSISGIGETLATFNDDGAVTLYHDNSAKLATASGGVNVTGDVNATTFVGNLTGNASGTAATVTTAAQPAITSVGTLTGLGIGAAASAGKLHVTHTTGTIGYFESSQASSNVSNLVGNATQTSSSANLVLQINGGTQAQALVRCNGDNSMAFFTGASPAERMRLNSTGLIIGGTAASELLHLSGSNCGIRLEEPGGYDWRINNDGGNLNFSSDDPSAWSDKMTLTNDGNVGIGVTPTIDSALAGLSIGGKVLHVHDGSGASLKLSDAASGANRGVGLANVGVEAALINCEAGDFRFGTGNQEKMRIDHSSSGVAIGSTAAEARLDVNGGHNGETAIIIDGTATGGGRKWGFRPGYPAVSNGHFTFRDETANATRWTVADNGFMAVGVGIPAVQFHCFGTGLKVESSSNNTIFCKNTTGAVEGGIQALSNQSIRLGSSSAHPTEIVYQNSVKATAHNTGFTVNGALAKTSGSFKIDHPLPEKTDDYHLVHSFVEGPQADLIYRGRVDLVDGEASINIDTAAGMTDGTFVLLNRDVQCFTSNETGWTAVRGSVSGNILSIEAQDNTCTDTISWMVVGERHDPHMYDTDWTDEEGKVIVEPLKPDDPFNSEG